MPITLTAKNTTEQRILDYLSANASGVLTEKINTGKKTLKGAVNYAKEEARKLAAGESSICVDDATVFGWIIHFFEEDHIAENSRTAAVVPKGVKRPTKPVAKPKPKPNRKPKPKPQQLEWLTMFEQLLGKAQQ